MLVPVAKRKLSQVAVERIGALIRSAGLKPGDRLPTEREFSERLNVSRTSVREALRTLEALGRIEVRPGQGTFVRDSFAETIYDFGTTIVPPSLEEIEELVEVRTMFESRACALAAQRAQPQDIESMQSAIDDMRRAYVASDMAGMVLADTSFHRAVIRATRNGLLMRLEAALSRQLMDSRRMSLSTPGKPVRSIRRHQLILEALKTRDGEWAASLMLDHIKSVKLQAENLRSRPDGMEAGVPRESTPEISDQSYDPVRVQEDD